MINCFKDPFHVLMTVLLSTNEDDGHEEVDDHSREESEEVDAREEYECHIGGGDTLTLTSSLRKLDSEKKMKKKVQWVDLMGIRELAEIREFQSSEEDDIDSKNCACVIL